MPFPSMRRWRLPLAGCGALLAAILVVPCPTDAGAAAFSAARHSTLTPLSPRRCGSAPVVGAPLLFARGGAGTRDAEASGGAGTAAASSGRILPYDVTDSLHLDPSDRPSLISAASNPRDALALSLLLSGSILAALNVAGSYGDIYTNCEAASAALGVASSLAALWQVRTGYCVSSVPRRGVIDDAVLNVFAGSYTAAATWLAVRESEACPEWLPGWDGTAVPWMAAAVFVFSIVAPALTLWEDGRGEEDSTFSSGIVRITRRLCGDGSDDAIVEEGEFPLRLSETELVRTRGLLVIGVLGCVFAPICLTFAVQSEEWWSRVAALHPSQRTLESTTALFAVYSTEASMVATRAAKAGVAPFRDVVPAFAAVCFVLAVIPCACALYWLGDGISFFSYYFE